MKLDQVSNWGKYPKTNANIRDFSEKVELQKLLSNSDGGMIARGGGRCYGDSALAPEIISTLRFNRLLNFDRNKGTITCQSGIELGDIINNILPAGYFLPVTPGTKFVTIGGAVASDVHGKNHHSEGSFCKYVDWLTIALENGRIVRCSRKIKPDLFNATCGGMGLTGVIIEASLRLKKVETAYIREEVLRARDLQELMALTEESGEYTYNVSWIDALATGQKRGRGVLFRGEHCQLSELPQMFRTNPLILQKKKPKNVPFNFPSFFLNRLSVSAFNNFFFFKQSKQIRQSIVYFDDFFYPMDGLLNWNRIYGRRGFLEYQFVVPKAESLKAITGIFAQIARFKAAPFFSGLKLFGPQKSLISFPIKGYTVAFDFPVTEKNLRLLNELDKIVIDHGGRVYLTKDARLTQAAFEDCYHNAGKFRKTLKRFNPTNKFRSLQSDRLGITS